MPDLGTCARCRCYRAIYGKQGWCEECCWNALQATDARPMDRCARCRRYVERTYQRAMCVPCLEAESALANAERAFRETHLFFRDAVLFNTPLTLRDFSRTWR